MSLTDARSAIRNVRIKQKDTSSERELLVLLIGGLN